MHGTRRFKHLAHPPGRRSHFTFRWAHRTHEKLFCALCSTLGCSFGEGLDGDASRVEMARADYKDEAKVHQYTDDTGILKLASRYYRSRRRAMP